LAGIYIHIPFCKQACNYCNFYFNTSLRYKDELTATLKQELILRKPFLENEKIETIYFGGGSPSLLDADEIQKIIDTIHKNYNIGDLKEITIEANPDDLTEQKISAFKSTDINRFSIGVQSFFDEDLVWMNRAHNSQQADRAIKAAQDKGFEKITIDLIYGIPTLSDKNWKFNLDKAIELAIPHISAYGLTVEEKTPLHKLIKLNKKENVDESKSAFQMNMLMEALTAKGFEHYEISNFAKPNFYAVHNTNYWKGVPYLGIGPSAHSYKDNLRNWNVANTQQYMNGIEEKLPVIENEFLTAEDIFNEWIMTGLRTQWGCNIAEAKNKFESTWINEMLNEAALYIANGKLLLNENILTISKDGKLIADRIMSDLFKSKN
jgi:oxygen-independent coproporphyrinogen-3 oxidase